MAPVQTPVLHGLSEVFRGDHFSAVKIGDRAGDFEDAVVSAGRKAEAADGHFESALTGFVQRAEFP